MSELFEQAAAAAREAGRTCLQRHEAERYEDYAALPGINASAIKAGQISMLHMHQVMLGKPQPESPAMRWGRLIHLAILEPARYGQVVSVWGGGRRAGGEWAQFVEDAGGPEWIVTAEENGDLLCMAAAVHGNREAHRIVAGTQHEVNLTWQGAHYGAGKGRIDMYDATKAMLADLKTTARIGSFERQFFNLGYDLQFGWLTEGTGATHRYAIAVESVPPYDVVVYSVPQQVIDTGRERAIAIASEYRSSEAAGCFLGVSGAESIKELAVPGWYCGGDNAEISMEGAEV